MRVVWLFHEGGGINSAQPTANENDARHASSGGDESRVLHV